MMFVKQLASLDDLKSLPTIPEYAWALDSHALAMQWFARNVSVDLCESSCQSSTSSSAPVLTDRRHSIANVSALALCDIVPDVGAIVLPDISIDCNLGIEKKNGYLIIIEINFFEKKKQKVLHALKQILVVNWTKMPVIDSKILVST